MFQGYSSSFIGTITSYVERYHGKLRNIPLVNEPGLEQDENKPNWLNGFFPGLDALVLYGILSSNEPGVFLEIGSGNSTRFAHQAKLDNGLTTKIISVDPLPRVECENLCDEIYRCRLEDLDQSNLRSLSSGDILFFDGSHRALMNSDTTVLFLEILPLLQKGVIVHLHDIFLPMDYPDEWSDRLYSEQYLAAVLLQWGLEQWDIVFANTYSSYLGEPSYGLSKFWDEVGVPKGHSRCGSSLWLRKKSQPCSCR